MPKAICVSINQLYPQLSREGLGHEAAGLHNITHAWWKVNPDAARGCKYLFGVRDGKVVSAYEITNDVHEWPVMPRGAILDGRRAIPSKHVSKEDWDRACEWRARMAGPVRYGEVVLKNGDFAELQFPQRNGEEE